ncbi:dynamin-related protein 1E-like protein [Tanacetum coccineum]
MREGGRNGETRGEEGVETGGQRGRGDGGRMEEGVGREDREGWEEREEKQEIEEVGERKKREGGGRLGEGSGRGKTIGGGSGGGRDEVKTGEGGSGRGRRVRGEARMEGGERRGEGGRRGGGTEVGEGVGEDRRDGEGHQEHKVTEFLVSHADIASCVRVNRGLRRQSTYSILVDTQGYRCDDMGCRGCINENTDMMYARQREWKYFATSPDYGHLANKMGSEYFPKSIGS